MFTSKYITLFKIYRFKGRKYNTCINVDVYGNGGRVSWCSTVLDSKGNHVPGNEAECNDDCAVSNCPVGFHWVASTGTCYMVRRSNGFTIILFV